MESWSIHKDVKTEHGQYPIILITQPWSITHASISKPYCVIFFIPKMNLHGHLQLSKSSKYPTMKIAY